MGGHRRRGEGTRREKGKEKKQGGRKEERILQEDPRGREMKWRTGKEMTEKESRKEGGNKRREGE